VAKIETGRFSELLRRSLGMKGVENVAPELSPELSPTWQLESARNQEWDYLKGVMQLSGTAGQSAGAAGGTFRLRNPEGSGVLLVVTKIQHVASVAGIFRMNVLESNLSLLNPGFKQLRETRWPTNAAGIYGVGLFNYQNNAGSVVSPRLVEMVVQANEIHTLDTQLVLRDGFQTTWGTAAIAVAYTYIEWYERPVLKLEL